MTGGAQDPRLQAISNSIRVIPHFPKHGIMFQDVTTLLLEPDAFQHSVDLLYEHYKDAKIDVVAGKSLPLCDRQNHTYTVPIRNHTISICSMDSCLTCNVYNFYRV